MLVGLQGPATSLMPGDEYLNCDPAEAQRLVAAGYAVVIATPVTERAVKKPVTEKRGKANVATGNNDR